jgi:hypothetical protein
MNISQCLRMAPLLALCGCATFMTAQDAEPILAPKLVGHNVSDLFSMFGNPDAHQVQQGHDVYYWHRATAYAYTPQYTATTQGNVGNTAFNSTTTMNGDVQAGATLCELVAGTMVGTDTVERIQLRGASCEAFIRK